MLYDFNSVFPTVELLCLPIFFILILLVSIVAYIRARNLIVNAIFVFATFNFMCIGESVILRHVRNGVELAPIDQNLYYDFDYQLTNHITPRVVQPVSIIQYVYKLSNINDALILVIFSKLLLNC